MGLGFSRKTIASGKSPLKCQRAGGENYQHRSRLAHVTGRSAGETNVLQYGHTGFAADGFAEARQSLFEICVMVFMLFSFLFYVFGG